GAEQLPGAVDGQLLGHVDVLAAAVVALVRIALGVLVGQHAALGLQHARAGVVLAGDQLDMVLLAAGLVGDGLGQFGVVGRNTGITRVHRRLQQAGKRGKAGQLYADRRPGARTAADAAAANATGHPRVAGWRSMRPSGAWLNGAGSGRR